MNDYSFVSFEEAVQGAVAESFFKLIKVIGEERSIARLAGLMSTYPGATSLQIMSYFISLGEHITYTEKK